ncbi:hypothetical protein TP41_08445 [Xanthomonas euvesicatoria pv. citrumelonis]|nr:hypothetical protein TP41_08445 [Xanthomonas euvesicatoria pv. citrumelonis]
MAHAPRMRHLQAAPGGVRSLIQHSCEGTGNSCLGRRALPGEGMPALQWRQVLRTMELDSPFRLHRCHCVLHTACNRAALPHAGIAACTATR